MIETLSLKEARKLVLHSQGILANPQKGRAQDVTNQVIANLSYVQIDTISVITRAHHHTLFNRNIRYQPNHMEQLLEQREIFEYWSHAAAYLPIKDYRYSLPNKQAILSGRKRWYPCDRKIKKNVLKRITEEGPLQSKDFENHGQINLPIWAWKPAKYALEQLFMEGRIMVTRREKFKKVYDLTERVLSDDVDSAMPTDEEFARHLITNYLQAHGIAQLMEIIYLRQGIKDKVKTALDNMLEDKALIQLQIQGEKYYCKPEALERLNSTVTQNKLKILSPFDNLVIQRKRLKRLFNFDYQIECYVPKVKRKFGYFCLPVLWQGRMVARLDCKACRADRIFQIIRCHLEPSLKNPEPFFIVLAKELKIFSRFNECYEVDVLESVNSPWFFLLKNALK